ncbi:ADP-ribosylation factor-like protein 2-binding protein [Euwallacea fornicatus]|uniref:ADP-ribosylation factor-like protein 2-binding protein n=1 Tax=Euwallacea fornicatus TaxID=995702 RepID=UPI00338E8491
MATFCHYWLTPFNPFAHSSHFKSTFISHRIDQCLPKYRMKMTEIGCGFDISHYCTERSERNFAQIVGCIENTIISEDFLEIQSKFLEQYYREFVEDEENRLVYMDIFKKYLDSVEKHIEEQLIRHIPGFDIRKFEKELEAKSNELDGAIYEMLSTFWDFHTFKQMFLEYRKMKEGKAPDFSQGILVTKCNLNLDA